MFSQKYNLIVVLKQNSLKEGLDPCLFTDVSPRRKRCEAAIVSLQPLKWLHSQKRPASEPAATQQLSDPNNISENSALCG